MSIPYLHNAETKLLLQVKKDIERHEGFREFAYPDPLSKLAKSQPNKQWGFKPAREIALPGTQWQTGEPWTYGFGFAVGITPDMRITRILAERKLEDHIFAIYDALVKALPWVTDATFVTKTVLINMAFNMGMVKLLKFKNTLQYIKAKNYKQAAANMKQSLWFKQVPNRASELIKRIETQTIEAAHAAPEKL